MQIKYILLPISILLDILSLFQYHIPISHISIFQYLNIPIPNRIESDFNFSNISETDILKVCDSLKPKSSTGADFISTKLLKQIAPMIITPLYFLVNLLLETGYVPR